jgi:prepilin-type N-terminal cleavage/methylation domain-containing protein
MHCTGTGRELRRVCARLREEHGFTIAELLIAMAILLVIMTALTSVLVTASKNELDVNQRFQAQAQARAGLDELRRELHCASSVTDTNGAALTPGTTYAAITATLGSTCATNVAQAATLYATWCTAASTRTTGDYALYRVTSTATPRPTCSTAGKVWWADYLTTPLGKIFCLPDSATACSGVLKPTNSLPMLHVAMPVNVNGPSSTIDGYSLVDDIALRNGARS